MEQRHMVDIPIGTTARSSGRAPVDGDYEFVEHIAASDCKPTGDDTKIHLGRGEMIPRCKKCGKRGIWKLAEISFDIPPEKNVTDWVVKTVRGDRADVTYPAGKKK
jgi:hypothetical protein